MATPAFRHDRDSYYMTQAFLVSRRSIDPRTQHGCIIVSPDNRILSTGYNGPLRGIDDARIPLEAPDKYYHILHSEENAYLNYFGSRADMQGATLFCTGECCHNCLRMGIQCGIGRFVQGHVQSVMIHAADRERYEKEQAAKRLMIELSGVVVENFGPKASIRKVLQDALDYFDEKAQK